MNENYLNQYIEELNHSISSNFKLIEFEFLNGYYGDTRLNPVRDEICKCIICNLGQAALTLTNHLLELALKNCLIRKYLKNNKDTLSENISDTFQQGIEKYDSQKMNDTINYAYDEGLLTEIQKTTLHTYRKKIRNAWGHAEGNKIFGGETIDSRFVGFNKGDNIETFMENIFSNTNREQFQVENFIPVQGLIQKQLADRECVPYFKEVDKIIREMREKI